MYIEKVGIGGVEKRRNPLAFGCNGLFGVNKNLNYNGGDWKNERTQDTDFLCLR